MVKSIFKKSVADPGLIFFIKFDTFHMAMINSVLVDVKF